MNDNDGPLTEDTPLDLEKQGFRLGKWTVHPLEGRLQNDELERRLSPKSMEVLVSLARTKGQVVKREDLLTRVWGERAVSDEPLTRCISELRRAFGDSRTAPEIIETISKRGYRLIPPVKAIRSEEDSDDRKQSSAAEPAQTGTASESVAEHPEKVRGGYKTIAVLPFANMSGDPEQEYFSDGITEDIISELSRMPWFFVTARNSSFAFKGSNKDLEAIAQELGIHYVVVGGVRKSGQRIRIHVQLIDASSKSSIWANQYDRDLVDIFAIQDEVATHIVGPITHEFLSVEARRARWSKKEDTAWDCVIHGRWHLWQLSRVDLAEARRLFARATELDPSGVAGTADLSLAHNLESYYNWAASREEALREAIRYAEIAASVSLHNPWSHTVLSLAYLYNRRYEEAVPPLEWALELAPNFAQAWGARCTAMAMLGQPEEALSSFKKSVRLSPNDSLIPLWQLSCGWSHWLCERYDEALAVSEECVQRTPDNPTARRLLAASLSVTGQKEAAKQALIQYSKLEPTHTARDIRDRIPSANPDQVERYIDALCRAGLPL